MKMKTSPRARQTKGAPVPVDAPAQCAPPPTGSAGGIPCDENGGWVRLPRARCTLRGFSRSFLFQLCAAGTVQSVVIQGPSKPDSAGRVRQRKTARGVRLVLLSSLDDFLAKQLRAQNGAREGGQ